MKYLFNPFPQILVAAKNTSCWHNKFFVFKNYYFASACAKGSCQIELYDFWHNPPPPPVRQRAPSLIPDVQHQPSGAKKTGSDGLTQQQQEEEEAVCENCIRRIVKSLAATSPVRGAGAPEAQGDERRPEAAISGPDSVCLVTDMK
jgi:hypothetical protein